MALPIPQRSAFHFIALFAAALVGFWPTYFVRLGEIPSWRVHVHGALMFGWIAMLIAQACLIRWRRQDTHRALGKFSYVLAPLIVISGVVVERDSLVRLGGKINEEAYFFAYLVPALLLLFAVLYGLAMYHRKTPVKHMRYMIGTALVMIDPIFARILDVHMGIGFGAGQLITFALTDAILIVLAYADRRSGARTFPIILMGFLLFQVPAFVVCRMAWWPDVVRAFAG